jgi:hypothetical protein
MEKAWKKEWLKHSWIFPPFSHRLQSAMSYSQFHKPNNNLDEKTNLKRRKKP